MNHDNGYKLLFSFPEMVRDLLTGFVHEEWVDQLDFSTLEKVSCSYVSDDLRDREDDVVWRVRWGDGWLYVYLLIEFQSKVERHMAVRVMTYLGLLYQDLIRQKAFTPTDRLPPVLPLVLYNGDRRWRAADDVAELIEPVPGGLEDYRPSLRYLLLDEGAIIKDKQAGIKDKQAGAAASRNLVAALFHLEHSRDEDSLLDVLGTLVEWLKTPEQTQLRRAFSVWIRRVLLPGRLPKLALAELEPMNELQEVHAVLAERVKEWHKRWEREGIEKGMQQGMQQGDLAARRKVARNLLQTTKLDDTTIAQVTHLDIAEIQAMRAETR